MILAIYLSILAQETFDPVADHVIYHREEAAIRCLLALVRDAPYDQIESILATRSDECRQEELAGMEEFQGNFHRPDVDLGVMQTRRWFPVVMQWWQEAHQ